MMANQSKKKNSLHSQNGAQRQRTQPQQPQQGKKRRSRRGKRRGTDVIRAFARMVSDPCNAMLVPGIYGSNEGILGRFKLSYTLPSIATDTAGWVLWVPTSTNAGVDGGTSGGFGNVFVFRANSGGTNPSNTTGVNGAFGAGLTTSVTSASSINDPCYAFLSGAVAQDARMLSSCIRVNYLGKLSDITGQLAYVENLPVDDLIGKLPSPNMLFDYSTKTQRLSLDTMDLSYRNSAPGRERFTDTFGNHAITVGPTGSVSSTANDATRFPSTCFGFAWRGLTAGTGSALNFEFVKNIEWRPETGQGMTAMTATETSPSGSELMGKTLSYLDSYFPGWTSHTYNAVASGVTSMAKAVFSGIMPEVYRGEGMARLEL